MSSFGDVNQIILEEDWPIQRLRVGWALVLFFGFEVLIGKSLPQIMPLLALAMGLGCLVSAWIAVRTMTRKLSR